MKRILVDTSVWRRHFAGRLTGEQAGWFTTLLDEDGALLVHPWVIGELVLGGLSASEEALLRLVPSAEQIADVDLLGFIRHWQLAQRGIGWVDVQLLACAITHSALLWATDKSLEAASDRLKVKFHGFQ